MFVHRYPKPRSLVYAAPLLTLCHGMVCSMLLTAYKREASVVTAAFSDAFRAGR
jgi:hypothetical protein